MVAKLEFTLLSFQRTTAEDCISTFLRPQNPRPPSSLGGPWGRRAGLSRRCGGLSSRAALFLTRPLNPLFCNDLRMDLGPFRGCRRSSAGCPGRIGVRSPSLSAASGARAPPSRTPPRVGSSVALPPPAGAGSIPTVPTSLGEAAHGPPFFVRGEASERPARGRDGSCRVVREHRARPRARGL